MLYDVTVPIRAGMPGYAGDPPVRIAPHLSLAGRDPVNVSRLELGSHTGTHVDAPRHLFEVGATVDALSLAALVGSVRVVDCTGTPRIAPDHLGPNDLAARRVLFKTQRAPGDPGGCMTTELAAACVNAGILLVGVDGISVDAPDAEVLPAHRTLLGAGIVILEGVDLSRVPAGIYELFCLPLKILNGDGAPARVLLRSSMD